MTSIGRDPRYAICADATFMAIDAQSDHPNRLELPTYWRRRLHARSPPTHVTNLDHLFMTPAAFEVTPAELKNISSVDAVNVLRDLLNAEAKVLGVPLTGVNVPANITTRDGGVDAG
jgi:hypothetical protein